MALVLGLNAKLYRNTATWATPTWDLITNVMNVTLSVEAATADVTTRANAGWRATVPTLKDASVEFEMVWDTGDADFTAFKDAWLNNTGIDIWVLDGTNATTGAQGLRALMGVTQFSRNEQLEEALKVSVTLKPTYSANAPEWKVVP